MEQDKLPCESPGPGQCGSDREVFERVWRRVMPEPRPGCPFRLYGEEEQREMERLLECGEAPPAEGYAARTENELPLHHPAVPRREEETAEAEHGAALAELRQEAENDVPCLGAASAVYGGLLQELIAHELSDARTYLLLARRAQGSAARTLTAMAADERRHAKRLSTAYFLISGVRFWPERMPGLPVGGTYLGALRTRFAEEQKGEAAYLAAAEETADSCLRELYLELAGDEAAHAWLIRSMLEQM